MLTPDARRLFSERPDLYARFIRFVRYPQGLRAYWLRSPLLASRPRILEAGCGTGALTFAVWGAAARRGCTLATYDAFDLTPAMLDRLRADRARHGATALRLVEADVLALDALPADWRDYDLVVTASMLEYVPRARFADARAGLRVRLRPGGTLVLFVTRRNPLTRFLIGRWWQSNLYSAAEVADACAAAGFSRVRFGGFPPAGWHLALWGHVVEAER